MRIPGSLPIVSHVNDNVVIEAIKISPVYTPGIATLAGFPEPPFVILS